MLKIKNYDIIFLSCLVIILFSSCKKSEERDLVKNYAGNYSAVRTSTSCCDSNLAFNNKAGYYRIGSKKINERN